MGTYRDLGDAIARNSSALDSALTVFQEIVQNLKDAQAANDPQEIDRQIASLDANTERLAKGIVKSTPGDAAPAEPLPPPVDEPTP